MSKSLTKQDFLEAGIGILGESGPANLNIVALCERLEVTRGSFYHHFKSLADYRQAFLDYWENEVIAARLKRAEEPASFAERSAAAIAAAQSADGKVERAIRAWGATEPEVATMLSRVDQALEAMVYRSLLKAGADAKIAYRYAAMAKLLALGLSASHEIPSAQLIEDVYQELEWAAEARIETISASP